MEPVSLAVGVVPLALNIVQLSSTIREHIALFKSAPDDIKAIIEKTDMIGDICRSLELNIPDCDSAKPSLLSDDSKRLLELLDQCYASIKNVHDSLKKVMDKGQKRKVATQYLFNKSKIDKAERDLDKSLSMLQLYMATNTL
jgi:hypothetical protein